MNIFQDVYNVGKNLNAFRDLANMWGERLKGVSSASLDPESVKKIIVKAINDDLRVEDGIGVEGYENEEGPRDIIWNAADIRSDEPWYKQIFKRALAMLLSTGASIAAYVSVKPLQSLFGDEFDIELLKKYFGRLLAKSVFPVVNGKPTQVIV